MTDPTFAALEEALTAELRATQVIAALADRERSALQDDDLAALADVIREKEEQLADLAALENARDEAASAWAAEHNLASDHISFDEILRHMDRQTARELSTLRDGIKAHLEYARSLNMGNRALLQAALDRHETLRDFLLGLASDDA
ncbi:MAG: flagellar export chaperone FlgN [Chloroflexi bacterium]|nr:flagellar export chaperone FlgN [Chloroflexota bacterium]